MGSAPKALFGDDLCRYVADSLDRGVGKAQICEEMIAMGYAANQTGPFVDGIAELQRKARIEAGLPRFPGATYADDSPRTEVGSGSGRNHMWIGAIVCMIGIFLTVGTYTAAQQSGGTYVVVYGAIICGAMQFFHGLWKSS